MNGGQVPETVVYMSGYLPGSAPEKSPILSPVRVHLSADSWKDVCGGGCGFAMAISGKGKLITWGSSDDEGQSYVASGKHGETPGPFPLPSEAPVVQASAGWAHCAVVTESGEAFTWGWKECIPSKDLAGKHLSISSEQGEESVKRRRVSTARNETDALASGEDFFATSPSLVSVGLGVRITSVATGGRHTLALSDIGQVWGWGYGGEGQLGLGSRIKMVSSPHPIPCIESLGYGKERSFVLHQGPPTTSTLVSRVPGQYVKAISCGGRHSAAITDTGGLITFGWGMYGQCGHGNTNDQLRPMAVSAMQNVRMESVAAGLWHTICISSDGKVFAFGGNQFGQLGTGTDNAETIPRLLDGQNMENKHAKTVSCGARHSAVLAGMVFKCYWQKGTPPNQTELALVYSCFNEKKLKSPCLSDAATCLQEMVSCYAGDGTNMGSWVWGTQLTGTFRHKSSSMAAD